MIQPWALFSLLTKNDERYPPPPSRPPPISFKSVGDGARAQRTAGREPGNEERARLSVWEEACEDERKKQRLVFGLKSNPSLLVFPHGLRICFVTRVSRRHISNRLGFVARSLGISVFLIKILSSSSFLLISVYPLHPSPSSRAPACRKAARPGAVSVIRPQSWRAPRTPPEAGDETSPQVAAPEAPLPRPAPTPSIYIASP